MPISTPIVPFPTHIVEHPEAHAIKAQPGLHPETQPFAHDTFEQVTDACPLQPSVHDDVQPVLQLVQLNQQPCGKSSPPTSGIDSSASSI